MAGDQITSTVPPLTPKAIEAAKPAAQDFELRDGGAPGLSLRVTAKGGRVFRWYVRAAEGGKVRAVTIGRWSRQPRPGYVTLGEARVWLERLKDAHRVGHLANAEADLRKSVPLRAPTPALPAAATAPTLAEVAKDFLVLMQRRRKHPDEIRRTIEKELVPALGERPITTITPRDVRLVVEAVVKRGSPTQAGKVLAHAKQLFRFACGRDEVAVAANPAAPLDPDALGVENNVCQRFLEPDEIRAFWNALEASTLSATVKVGLRILALTGVRTCELLRARWPEVDLKEGSWVVPVSSQKLNRRQEQTARPWIVPLSPQVMELFEQAKAMGQGSAWVLASPLNPKKPVSQKALVTGMRKLFEAPEGREPLLRLADPQPTPHDLRRTLRHHLEETLGVPEVVCERALNHSRGHIVKVYAGSVDLLAERRVALERWAAYVAQVASGKPATVVVLRAGDKA